jgi:hypothetical protein
MADQVAASITVHDISAGPSGPAQPGTGSGPVAPASGAGGPVLTAPRAPLAFHMMARPAGAICNLDCEYRFFMSKTMLYPGSRFKMAAGLQETCGASPAASATVNRSWTPQPRDGSPPNPIGKIPAAAALTGEPSGHVSQPDPM